MGVKFGTEEGTGPKFPFSIPNVTLIGATIRA